MNVTVPAGSCPVPDAPTLEHEAAKWSHKGHRTDHGHNQQNDQVKSCLGIHAILRSRGVAPQRVNCIRTPLKNKKATEPRLSRLLKAQIDILNTCHHRRRAAWELLSSSPGSRKPKLRL
jgi:hypothetical protein